MLEPDPATLRSQQEVRAPIVAMKPVKADGAKGGRKANPRKPNVTGNEEHEEEIKQVEAGDEYPRGKSVSVKVGYP